MRLWLFHPVIFYPVVLGLALLVVGLSLKPQSMPRPAAAVAGQIDGPTVLLQRDAFNSPVEPPEQFVTVVRNYWGQPQSLRIAIRPGMGPVGPQERGVEIRLTPETARLLQNHRLMVEVAYQPLAVNAAPVLGVASLDSEPPRWIRRNIPPLAGVARFELASSPDINAIGLRIFHFDRELAYGVEILSIRISPR